MHAVQVNLTGMANVSRQPERGVVTVDVSSHGEDQSKVSKDVQDAVKAIHSGIQPLTERATQIDDQTNLPAIVRWSSSAMSTRTNTIVEWVDKFGNIIPDPHQSGVFANGQRSNMPSQAIEATGNKGIEKKTRKIFNASIQIIVRFTDFYRLSEFTTSLATRDVVEVSHVSWILTDETQKTLRNDAIKQAYQDGFEKATALQEAMGAQFVRPVSIQPQGQTNFYNSGMQMQAQQPMGSTMSNQQQSMLLERQHRKRLEMAGASKSESQTLAYVPQDVSVSMSWDIKFEIHY